MSVMVILGAGSALQQACNTATEMKLDFIRLELPSADGYNFDSSALLTHYAAADTEVFVALDERAVNYARHKLIAEVRLAGYRLLNLVSPRALVDADIRLPGNVHIGPGCNLTSGSSIGLGCWLERQVLIADGVKLGACVTLKNGVQIEPGAEIGKGTTLGGGSIATAGTKVGHHCEWLLPGMLPKTLADCSFYDALMPNGAQILT